MSGGAGFVHGARHALGGFSLILRPGIRPFVLVPLAINVVLFVLALAGIGSALEYVVDRYLAGWPEWAQWLLWMVFGLLATVIVFFTFTLLANIIASPFNGMLAEAVERHLMPTAAPAPFSWRRLLAEAGRTITAELRKLGYIALRALPLLILSLIPIVNVVAPALWLLFGAWMFCIEYLDCPLGNHGRLFPSVVTEMRAHRRMALGFGGCMIVLTMIPVLNFLAMPVGVAGATSMYCAHFADAVRG